MKEIFPGIAQWRSRPKVPYSVCRLARSKPYSRRTHNKTMKKLALFCNCQLNYDRITALNLNPVGVYSILQSNQIKSGILSHLHRNSNNSQISQSDWYRRNREVWASVRRGFSEESLLTERAIIKSKSTGEQGTHHHKPRGRGYT